MDFGKKSCFVGAIISKEFAEGVLIGNKWAAS